MSNITSNTPIDTPRVTQSFSPTPILSPSVSRTRSEELVLKALKEHIDSDIASTPISWWDRKITIPLGIATKESLYFERQLEQLQTITKKLSKGQMQYSEATRERIVQLKNYFSTSESTRNEKALDFKNKYFTKFLEAETQLHQTQLNAESKLHQAQFESELKSSPAQKKGIANLIEKTKKLIKNKDFLEADKTLHLLSSLMKKHPEAYKFIHLFEVLKRQLDDSLTEKYGTTIKDLSEEILEDDPVYTPAKKESIIDKIAKGDKLNSKNLRLLVKDLEQLKRSVLDDRLPVLEREEKQKLIYKIEMLFEENRLNLPEDQIKEIRALFLSRQSPYLLEKYAKQQGNQFALNQLITERPYLTSKFRAIADEKIEKLQKIMKQQDSFINEEELERQKEKKGKYDFDDSSPILEHELSSTFSINERSSSFPISEQELIYEAQLKFNFLKILTDIESDTQVNIPKIQELFNSMQIQVSLPHHPNQKIWLERLFELEKALTELPKRWVLDESTKKQIFTLIDPEKTTENLLSQNEKLNQKMLNLHPPTFEALSKIYSEAQELMKKAAQSGHVSFTSRKAHAQLMENIESSMQTLAYAKHEELNEIFLRMKYPTIIPLIEMHLKAQELMKNFKLKKISPSLQKAQEELIKNIQNSLNKEFEKDKLKELEDNTNKAIGKAKIKNSPVDWITENYSAIKNLNNAELREKLTKKFTEKLSSAQITNKQVKIANDDWIEAALKEKDLIEHEIEQNLKRANEEIGNNEKIEDNIDLLSSLPDWSYVSNVKRAINNVEQADEKITVAKNWEERISALRERNEQILICQKMLNAIDKFENLHADLNGKLQKIKKSSEFNYSDINVNTIKILILHSKKNPTIGEKIDEQELKNIKSMIKNTFIEQIFFFNHEKINNLMICLSEIQQFDPNLIDSIFSDPDVKEFFLALEKTEEFKNHPTESKNNPSLINSINTIRSLISQKSVEYVGTSEPLKGKEAEETQKEGKSQAEIGNRSSLKDSQRPIQLKERVRYNEQVKNGEPTPTQLESIDQFGEDLRLHYSVIDQELKKLEIEIKKTEKKITKNDNVNLKNKLQNLEELSSKLKALKQNTVKILNRIKNGYYNSIIEKPNKLLDTRERLINDAGNLRTSIKNIERELRNTVSESEKIKEKEFTKIMTHLQSKSKIGPHLQKAAGLLAFTEMLLNSPNHPRHTVWAKRLSELHVELNRIKMPEKTVRELIKTKLLFQKNAQLEFSIRQYEEGENQEPSELILKNFLEFEAIAKSLSGRPLIEIQDRWDELVISGAMIAPDKKTLNEWQYQCSKALEEGVEEELIKWRPVPKALSPE